MGDSKVFLRHKPIFRHPVLLCFILILGTIVLRPAGATDLPDIRQAGVLRHLGVPYANFVTGSGDGLDVEMIKLFARHLGVRYEYVRTDWQNVISDLTGQRIAVKNGHVEVVGRTSAKGDIIANGMTVLPWRSEVIDFSSPTFPTQVWLVALADSTMKPIAPTGDTGRDIFLVKETLKGHPTIGKKRTCLDPDLYNLQATASSVHLFDGAFNELAPAVLQGMAESTILDVPDALIALEKWPGQLKVIGPISQAQEMAVGFRKDAPLLRQAFEKFLATIMADGTYDRLVKKYYLSAYNYYSYFFAPQHAADRQSAHPQTEGDLPL